MEIRVGNWWVWGRGFSIGPRTKAKAAWRSQTRFPPHYKTWRNSVVGTDFVQSRGTSADSQGCALTVGNNGDYKTWRNSVVGTDSVQSRGPTVGRKAKVLGSGLVVSDKAFDSGVGHEPKQCDKDV
jgi:hypothetical protein